MILVCLKSHRRHCRRSSDGFRRTAHGFHRSPNKAGQSAPLVVCDASLKRMAWRKTPAFHGPAFLEREESDDYISHLQKNTFPQPAHIPGCVSASILRRNTARGVEFVILTTWHSMEAIRQFAGESADVAVVTPVAQALMVEYDKKVAHYEIAYTYQRE